VNTAIRALGFAVCLASLLLTGCGAEQPAALVSSAKNYLAKNEIPAAVIQLKAALQKQPDLAEARFLLGRTLLENGDPVSGEVELRKALALKYPASAVLPLLARSLVMQRKGQRAIDEFASIDLGAPAATAELKTTIATAYAQAGDLAKSRAALAAALRAAPDFSPALLMNARLKASENDSDAALALVDRVIANDADNHEALQLKGDLLLARGDSAAALQAQRQALSKRADWAPAHSSAIEILLLQGDLVAAKAQLEQMKKALPNHPQTVYYRARIAAADKDYKTARELTQALLKGAPDNFKVLLLAGAIELEAGSLPQAENFVTKAMRLSPDAVNARRLLAQIYLRSGQPQKVEETLQPMLGDQNPGADALNLAAEAALQLGDAKKAVTYFQRAAKVNPADPRSRTMLALDQIAKGNADAGFAELEKIASTDKGTATDLAIISARLSQKDYAAAFKAIDTLEKKRPGEPFAAQIRGQVEMVRGDVAAARKSFAKALEIDPSYFAAAAGLAALDLLEKKPDDARRRFEALLSRDPKDIRALLAITELRARAGASKAEVARSLAHAIEVNPTIASPRVLLIELNMRHNDVKAALGVAQEAVAAIPNDPDLLDALARAQLMAGDSNQAISTFNKLSALQPASPQPYLRLADAYIALNDREGARTSLNRAIEVAPKFLPALRGLVVLELAAGRPEKAMAVARALQRDRPDLNVGYLFAGDIEATQKNWSAAAAAYRAGLGRAETSDLAAKLHSVLIAGSKRGEADSFAARWLEDHPNDAAFRSYLGGLALSKHDYSNAEAHFLAVVKMQPDNAVALNNLAWITHKLKKPGAAAYAERANVLTPGQPAVMDTLAAILADDGKEGKALEIQKKVIELRPDYAPFRLNLAKIYIKVGDREKARNELEQLAKLGDKFSRQSEVNELLKAL